MLFYIYVDVCVLVNSVFSKNPCSIVCFKSSTENNVFVSFELVKFTDFIHTNAGEKALN